MGRFGFCVCLYVGLLSTLVAAHDLVAPDWRGQAGTTFQEWQFSTGDNPASPEVKNNDYGAAVADITVGALGEGWVESLPGFGSQTGLWDLGGEAGQALLSIANRPEALPYKEIWVQVTYYMDISQAPAIDVPGASYIGGQTGILVEDTGMGSGWFLNQSIWRIEPNPASEQIILTSDASWGSVIDQVVVDTICVPEPATIGLLGAAVLAFVRRKR